MCERVQKHGQTNVNCVNYSVNKGYTHREELHNMPCGTMLQPGVGTHGCVRDSNTVQPGL